MKMHDTLFAYLKPTDDQIAHMNNLRLDYAQMLACIEFACPDGAYKMLAIRALEESAMWANKGLTRDSDGTPRK